MSITFPTHSQTENRHEAILTITINGEAKVQKVSFDYFAKNNEWICEENITAFKDPTYLCYRDKQWCAFNLDQQEFIPIEPEMQQKIDMFDSQFTAAKNIEEVSSGEGDETKTQLVTEPNSNLVPVKFCMKRHFYVYENENELPESGAIVKGKNGGVFYDPTAPSLIPQSKDITQKNSPQKNILSSIASFIISFFCCLNFDAHQRS